MYACMYVCMDGWMDGWMYVCMYIRMYVSLYIYNIYIYTRAQTQTASAKLIRHAGPRLCVESTREAGLYDRESETGK